MMFLLFQLLQSVTIGTLTSYTLSLIEEEYSVGSAPSRRTFAPSLPYVWGAIEVENDGLHRLIVKTLENTNFCSISRTIK